ncbi:MAG TPA: hypothetical protein VMV05_10425 [bacterium]|nr:hypothetical protein [bacterium]
MGLGKRINQNGWGFFDLLFWAVILIVLAWAVKQYILNPGGLNPRPVNHSQYEDRK